jgi:hypothetical protein
MIFSLIVVSLLSGIVLALFLGIAAFSYLHVPAKVRVESRQSRRKN